MDRNARTVSMVMLEKIADTDLVSHVRELLDSGDGTWIWDPEVENVTGFDIKGIGVTVVIYLDDEDLEVDTEFFYGS